MSVRWIAAFPAMALLLAWTVDARADLSGEMACRALHEAVFMDEPAEVMALIKKGVDVNCLDQLRHTPIITATTGASLESFIVLLKHGAKVNVKDEWGMTLIRRIQERMRSYMVDGGDTYRRIFQRMADLVTEAEAVN